LIAQCLAESKLTSVFFDACSTTNNRLSPTQLLFSALGLLRLMLGIGFKKSSLFLLELDKARPHLH
jgi:hypothetical protein